MTIVDLRKATLIGLANQRREVLAGLQALGVLHLETLSETTAATAHIGEVDADLTEAIAFLLAAPFKRRQIKDPTDFDPATVTRDALRIRETMRELEDRREALIDRIENLEPWGNFDFPDLDDLSGYKLWFYILPHYQMARVVASDLVWQVVHRDNRDAYLVVVSKTEPPEDAMPVPRVHTGSITLARLQEDLDRVEIAMEEAAIERTQLTRWIHLLLSGKADYENRLSLNRAELVVLDAGEVFAVAGWAPEDTGERLAAFASQHGLALLWEAPSAEDAPPTLLKNPPEVAAGADIVNFFQTPGYGSWDPSAVIFFSFAVFFALILSDAGYALVFTLFPLLMWRKLSRSPRGRRLGLLGLAMGLAGVVYGALVGSYFGTPPPAPFLAQVAILDVRDFDAMIRLSVFIGIIHIAVANLARAWAARGSSIALAPLGWFFLIAAGTAYWLQGEPTLVSWISGGLGLGAVLFFSGSAPLAGAAGIGRRLFEGLKGLTDVTKAFGDVLSYLRLFALGLASASLATTFNQMAADVAERFAGIGIVFAAMLLVLGHALNFVLAVVSGVVHGLRLNLIEFYNWSISQEGYPFRAFAKKEIDPWNRS